MQHYPGILPRFGERLLRKLWRLDKGRNIKGTTKGWLDDFLNAAFTLGYALKGRGEITLSSDCIFTIYRQHNISIGRWTFQRQAFHYMRVVMFGAVPTVPPIAPKMEKKKCFQRLLGFSTSHIPRFPCSGLFWRTPMMLPGDYRRFWAWLSALL